jgi:predicted transcriptional regulator
MSKKRSRLEVYLDVLRVIRGGYSKPTDIMHKCNISWITLKEILGSLMEKGLVTAVERNRRKLFVITAKGEAITAKVEDLFQGRVIKPFEISTSERDSMTSEELTVLYDSLLEEYGRLIRESLGKGSRYIVLCDGKVVYASNREPTDEEIRNLEKNLGKVCYVLTEDPIEESHWSPIGDKDFYPTIDVFIGGANWEDEEIFRRGLKITSDFDTGNPDVAAFSNEDVNLIQPTVTHIMRRAFHLGKYYDYHLTTLKIGIKDSGDVKRCITKPCRSVLSWTKPERNPFLLANPNRKGFVGRDLMLSFPLNIQLSGKNKQSIILIE